MPMPHTLSDEFLPDYTPAAIDFAKLPLYSPEPREQEYVLTTDATQPCTQEEGKMTFISQDMSVILGPRIWGFDVPTYGYEGVVKGDIKLSGKARSSACQLCVTLAITAAVKGQKPKRLFSERKQIYNSSVDCRPISEVLNFSIPIPCEVTVDGEKLPAPPSLEISAAYSKAAVVYEVVFTLTKKGFYKTESSLRVPIMYLPKTRPSRHPIKVMPQADCEGKPYCEEQGVHTDILTFDCPKPHSKELLPSDIYYSRPDVESFASGSEIPIVLTVKNIPTTLVRDYLRELAVGISGTIHRRTKIANPLLRGGYAWEDRKLDYVLTFTIHNVGGGVYQLHGSLGTGNEGCEGSWHVPHAMDVQYLIKLQSHPKPGTTFVLPHFSHTDKVALTTDQWGTTRYELASTSGRPVPAIGLHKSGTHVSYADTSRPETPENTDPNRFKITV